MRARHVAFSISVPELRKLVRQRIGGRGSVICQFDVDKAERTRALVCTGAFKLSMSEMLERVLCLASET